MDKQVNNTTCIRTFSSRSHAEVAKSLLSARGIRAFVLGDDAGGMYPPLADGIKLVVNKKDKKKAMEAIII